MFERLYIVARSQPHLYEYLRRSYEEPGRVAVIYDRRFGERRRQTVGSPAERRRADRRERDVRRHLVEIGWAIVKINGTLVGQPA